MSYDEALGATLIERGIREKIVLVGVTIPPAPTRPKRSSTSWSCWSTLRPTSWRASNSGVSVPTPQPSSAGARRRAARAVPGRGRRHGLHQRPDAAQQYNLEKLLGRTAIERTAVILDIFAQHVYTLEGRAQVELALAVPPAALRRCGAHRLSQQGGGIGTRQGPRRRSWRPIVAALRRIARLQRDLASPAQPPAPVPQPRPSGLANVTIGYTNAGKSTLQPPDGRRRPGRRPALRHPRPDHPPPRAPGW